MATISMREFRQNVTSVIRRVSKGERIVLTYRGKPAIRLAPVCVRQPEADDPFYRLGQLADAKGQSLTNRKMDRIIYDP